MTPIDRPLRTLIWLSVVICLVNGTGDLIQVTGGPTADPLHIAGMVWFASSCLLASSALLLHSRAIATLLFVAAGGTLSFVLPLFETPYGSIMAACLGPVYTMLLVAALAPAGVQPFWPALLGIGSTATLVTRHWLRPMEGFSDPMELVFACAGTGLAVFAMCSLGQWLLDSNREVRMRSERALEKLRRNHDALELSRDAALAASRAKAAFLANMSHELRTPLNAILGYVELMLEESELPPATHRDLEHVATAGHHLLSTITEILDLSRIEAGHTIVEIGRVEVHALCDEVGTILQPLVVQKGNELVVSVPEAVLNTDGPRLRQVLVNLLGNANKFTTAGRIGLEVTPLVRAERAGFAFVVTDTGIGIEPERLQAIFEPFHTSGSGGSGIGLTVSLAIAEQLGGTLTVASTVGQGSTFTLWLPRRSDTTPQSD